MKTTKQENKYLIYALKDPRTNEIRYVGKSSSGMHRPKQHMTPHSLKKNDHKNNWIKVLLSLDLSPVIEILEILGDAVNLYERERHYVAHYKALNCNLTNLTDGGEGTHGYKHKEETIKLMSKKAKARDWSDFIPVNKQEHIFDNGIEKRKCTKCETYKTLELFCINSKNGNFRGFCKECDKLRKQASRALKPDSARYVKLSPEAYKASRIEAARKGGLALAANPEARASISAKRSKPIIGNHEYNNSTIEFPSALKAKEQGFHNKLIHDAIKSGRPYKNYYWKFK